MFNLGGWGEILIIAITALIVLKPEDLPKVMHQIGRWMLTLRRLKYQLQTYYLDALYATEREEMHRQAQEEKERKTQASARAAAGPPGKKARDGACTQSSPSRAPAGSDDVL